MTNAQHTHLQLPPHESDCLAAAKEGNAKESQQVS